MFLCHILIATNDTLYRVHDIVNSDIPVFHIRSCYDWGGALSTHHMKTCHFTVSGRRVLLAFDRGY